MKMFVISDNTDTRTGLRLVGVGGALAHTREEFQAAVDGVLADRDIGVLLIVERLARQFPDIVNELRMDRRLPLVVEIPDRHGTGRRPDFITAHIKEAIGIKL